MHISTKTFILILLVTLLLTPSCKDKSNPVDTILVGDRSTVFNFFRFDEVNIPLTSEMTNDGWNFKNYSRLLDLNEDESFDINLFYNQVTSIRGDEIYYTAISEFNNSFEVVGQTVMLEGSERWIPILFESGQSVSLSRYNLGVDTSETYISYKAKDTGQIEIELNAFPIPESDAYLVFKISALNNRDIMGWLHIEQLANLHGIRILDVGYNYLN